MSEEIQFKCELCGESFDPIPDAMVEWEFGVMTIPCDENEPIQACECDDAISGMGLSKDQIEAIERGELVKIGGCVCIACQDQMLKEAEDLEAD